MFAIIETGGKQYKVAPGKRVKVDRIIAEPGSDFVFDKVLLVSGEKPQIGAPYVKGAKVEAKITKEGRAKRKIVYKYHSKNRFDKKKSNREHYTEVEIIKITA